MRLALYRPLRAGPVTADRRREFNTRLQAARRDRQQREARELGARMRGIIRNLSPGSVSTVIEIGAAGVTVTTVHLDLAGSPQVRDGGGATWSELLPALPAAEQARHRALADGDGLGDVATTASLLDDRLPPIPDGPMLVICGPASWRVLEGAATALASRPRATVLRLFLAGGGAARAQLGRTGGARPAALPVPADGSDGRQADRRGRAAGPANSSRSVPSLARRPVSRCGGCPATRPTRRSRSSPIPSAVRRAPASPPPSDRSVLGRAARRAGGQATGGTRRPRPGADRRAG